jgi:predicted permease
MGVILSLLARLRAWRRRLNADRDIDDELRAFIDDLTARNSRKGLSPSEARRAALVEVGGVEHVKEAAREVRAGEALTIFLRDTRHGWRVLWRSPAFATVAVLTLAIGIGANAAIFSVVDGVVFQPLPYAAADRLHRVRTLYPDGTAYSVSAPDFMSLRQDSLAIEQLEAYGTGALTLTGTGDPIEVAGAQVSDGLFTMLGLSFAHGRPFLQEEHRPGGGDVIVLSFGFWQRQFGAAPGIIGQTLTLSGRTATVVGVLAAGARLPLPADVYTPVRYGPTFSASTADGRRSEFLAVIARTRQGVDVADVNRDLARVGESLQASFPQSNDGLTFIAAPLKDFIVGGARTPLLILLGAVGLVLLVACVNVANLLLARASTRRAEMAVRAALGAGRARLLRQLLTESLVLAVLGGVLGVGIAYGATTALVAWQPGDIPRLDEIGVNARVLWFTAGMCLLTSLLFGGVPALNGVGADLNASLRLGGRSEAAGGTGQRTRAALVIVEMALAVALLTGAGLLMRSFVNLSQPPEGVRLDQGLAFRLSLPPTVYPDADRLRQSVQTLEERLAAVPGVRSVAFTTVLPMKGRDNMVGFAVDGAPPPPANVNPEISIGAVSAHYFDTIGATLRRGRALTSGDHSAAPPVVVINQAGVRRWFADVDAIGRFVQVNGRRFEVVGVVDDIPQRSRDQAVAPALFAPLAQRPARTVHVVLRTTADPLTVLPAATRAIRRFDTNLALVNPIPLSQLADDAVAGPRFYMSLLTLFAAVALVLAATGIFGIMSHTVAQRTSEIGIRMALGASASSIIRMVMGQALVLTGVGAVLGITGALSLGRVIQGQLFGVPVVDIPTIVAVVGTLMVVGIVAVLAPASRAARVDPVVALRR